MFTPRRYSFALFEDKHLDILWLFFGVVTTETKSRKKVEIYEFRYPSLTTFLEVSVEFKKIKVFLNSFINGGIYTLPVFNRGCRQIFNTPVEGRYDTGEGCSTIAPHGFQLKVQGIHIDPG